MEDFASVGAPVRKLVDTFQGGDRANLGTLIVSGLFPEIVNAGVFLEGSGLGLISGDVKSTSRGDKSFCLSGFNLVTFSAKGLNFALSCKLGQMVAVLIILFALALVKVFLGASLVFVVIFFSFLVVKSVLIFRAIILLAGLTADVFLLAAFSFDFSSGVIGLDPFLVLTNFARRLDMTLDPFLAFSNIE